MSRPAGGGNSKHCPTCTVSHVTHVSVLTYKVRMSDIEILVCDYCEAKISRLYHESIHLLRSSL